MLYMVEMELPDRSREVDWHSWYSSHIRKLLTVDGYHGGQRFESLTPSDSPFLALHQVDSLDVFDSEQYRKVGGPSGTGKWQPLMTNWYRNLFSGIDEIPEVAMDEHLVVVEHDCELPQSLVSRTLWLESAGLDRSTPRRGLIVLQANESLASLKSLPRLRIFKTLTPKLQ